jgi:hypothetical protein
MENNFKALVINRDLVLTAALVGVAVLAPLLHSQLVTGTIVNAALFGAVMLVGFRAALAVAFIPSLIALSVGTLPALMAVMVPFIMLSNLALVSVFMLLKKYGYWLSALTAAGIKFVILALCASAVMGYAVSGGMQIVLSTMMGYPQLITALFGACLAKAVIKR